MISLDTQQLLDLEHFHRVIGLTNNFINVQTLKFYRDNVNYSYVTKNKMHRFENCLTMEQKYGMFSYLYVPISMGKKHQQLPWKGYDIDWGVIAQHKEFEAKMIRIAKFKSDFIREYQQEKEKVIHS